MKDGKIFPFDAVEYFLVNGAHDPCGQERFEVGPWRHRRREACPRLRSLVAHEGFESSAILQIEDFLFAHAEAGKVILRQINPALAGILSGAFTPPPGARLGVLVCGSNTDPASVVG